MAATDTNFPAGNNAEKREALFVGIRVAKESVPGVATMLHCTVLNWPFKAVPCCSA